MPSIADFISTGVNKSCPCLTAARSLVPASAGREPIMWAGLSLSPQGLSSHARRRVTLFKSVRFRYSIPQRLHNLRQRSSCNGSIVSFRCAVPSRFQDSRGSSSRLLVLCSLNADNASWRHCRSSSPPSTPISGIITKTCLPRKEEHQSILVKAKLWEISSDTNQLQLFKLHHFRLERFKSI